MISLVEENDDLAGNGDCHYTQGLRLSYALSENRTPDWAASWAEKLPAMGMRLAVPRVGLEIGQNIYTPKNIFTPSMDHSDRPYAGWLYLGAYLQRRGLTRRGTPVLDHLGLDVGVLGPDSLAQDTQTWWHSLGGWLIPMGWHNQLKSEPGFVFKYERQWKFTPTRPEAGWGVEFIPHAGVSLGTVQTFGAAGGMLRAGYNIPDDFGVQNIDSLAAQAGGRTSRTRPFGGYLFAAIEGRAVGRNAFLDGNLWRPSLSVAKEPLVGDFRGGAVLTFKYFEFAVTYVERTPEFKMQSRNDRFGSISIGVNF